MTVEESESVVSPKEVPCLPALLCTDRMAGGSNTGNVAVKCTSSPTEYDGTTALESLIGEETLARMTIRSR